MEEQTLYRVCPHRNVAAAYQRFLGPDSGGIERFFGDERILVVDASHLVAAVASACNHALAGMVSGLEQRVAVFCEAAYALFVLILFVMKESAQGTAEIAAALRQAYAARLARGLDRRLPRPAPFRLAPVRRLPV